MLQCVAFLNPQLGSISGQMELTVIMTTNYTERRKPFHIIG